MATQFHVSHSAIIKGMAGIAGAPYWCANFNVVTALGSCSKYPNLISISELLAATTYAYETGTIDEPSNLRKTKVWLFTGKLDSIVNPGVVEKMREYYSNFIPPQNIIMINNISAEHAWITDQYGSKCSYLGSPFINNCNFDVSGQMLQYFYGKLNPRTNASLSNILPFDQSFYTPVAPSLISMANKGYVYVPTKCESTQSCKLHIFFHGCEMTTEQEGNFVYTHTGLNEWAESNNIIVLYPQIAPSAIIPYNPLGCWDWWGYTSIAYATKIGPQILSVSSMISAITGTL